MSPADRLLDVIEPGHTVFVPGSSGEPTAALQTLARNPSACEGVHFITTFVPGINTFDLGALGPGARFTSFFMHPSLKAAQADGRLRLIDLSWSQLVDWLARQRIDVAFAQVSAERRDGRGSLGPAVEFTPLVLERAARKVAVCNASTPWIDGSATLEMSGFDVVIEASVPLPNYPDPQITDIYRRIGSLVAELVPDGSSLQVGLGQAPAAVLDALHDHRDLGFHSGIFFDSLLRLIDAGAMASGRAIVSGLAVGSQGFYERLPDYPAIRLTHVAETHAPGSLGSIDRLFTINSALEVDLEGNVNAQTMGGRRISGPGGLPDYAAAGHRSPGGASIIVLPSTDRTGEISRIVERVEHTTVPGDLIDYVITEHGCARLAGKSGDERARQLGAIAAPGLADRLTSD